MKLLLYSHFFAPSIGGVETIVLSLARGLAGLRDSNGKPQFEVTLVTQTPGGKYDDSSLSFRVIREPSFFQLWQLVRSAEIIHVAGPALTPLLLGLLARKRVVIEHHGFQTVCPNGQLVIEPACKPCPGHFVAGRHRECLRCNARQGWITSRRLWFLTFVRRFLCARVAANITPTRWLGGLLRLPKSTVISHGVEATAMPERSAQLSGPPVIAFQGRLVSAKGIRILLEAALLLRKQNRMLEVVIIGRGPERASLEQFVRERQLASHVRFAGRLEGQQLETEFGRASAIVVPSLGGEVFGLVVAENMLRALPVLASDLGAFTEVLGSAGLTFRTGDPADLAAKLEEILDNPSFAASLGQAGRQRVLQVYSVRRMIESHADVYLTLNTRAGKREGSS